MATPDRVAMATYILQSAEFDRTTGTIVLWVRGHQPIRLAASPEALRDLKAAVEDGCAGGGRDVPRPPERGRGI